MKAPCISWGGVLLAHLAKGILEAESVDLKHSSRKKGVLKSVIFVIYML